MFPLYGFSKVCVFVRSNQRSVLDTTGLCFMITSLQTICFMFGHHLGWKAPPSHSCEFTNTCFRK